MLRCDSYFSEHLVRVLLECSLLSSAARIAFYAHSRRDGPIDTGSFTGAREESPRTTALSCKLHFSSLVSFEPLG